MRRGELFATATTSGSHPVDAKAEAQPAQLPAAPRAGRPHAGRGRGMAAGHSNNVPAASWFPAARSEAEKS